ncbi:MAG: aromatic ring-hydroxylating dioxygenase subunit alpha [Alphaproteobacteria bacterium]|nr:aromatic ring-hydroxylating dioxygenase subunit alpha [Alphaproteobacteria bacterium]
MVTGQTVEDILGREAVVKLRQPIDRACGLPGAAYTSEEFFRLEQKRLFPRTWMCLAFASDVPQPGDAIPLTAAGIPVILVRDRQGEIKVFHNVCRHRAAMIVTAPCQGLKQFACPYHAWAYDLDGRLKAVPYFDGTKDGHSKLPLDLSKLGLVPVRAAVWHHWVFINLDGNAAPFAEHVRPLEELINGADLGATRIGHREDWEWRGNWKMQNDNWETYHHTWVHKNVFTRISDDLDLQTGEPKSEPIPLGTVVTLKRRGDQDVYPGAGDLPVIPFPAGRKRVRCTSVLFPNMTLTLGADQLASVIADPLAADRTVSKMGYFFVGEAATNVRFAEPRARALARWLGATGRQGDRGGIRSQDMLIWEQQQKARRSPVADEVVFSPVWEKNVHHFQNMLIDVISAPTNH